ncbi:MAG TPA: hypothetical protein VFM05_06330 [Candidatus Saccharimonadales bacterium]|nr:hypothetical protein [Candidatus Saccharimonadales bacterium]
MDQLSIMRRANGELFTLTLKGRKHLALWPSLKIAIHYKTRNPELLVFSPALVASAFGRKSLVALQKENLGLFLLTDTGDAHFRDGRKISWKELENILPASSLASTASMPSIDRLNDDGGNQSLVNKKVQAEEVLAT